MYGYHYSHISSYRLFFYIMPVYNAVLRRVMLLSLLLFAQALFVEILIQQQSVLVCSHGLFVFHFHRIDILVS